VRKEVLIVVAAAIAASILAAFSLSVRAGLNGNAVMEVEDTQVVAPTLMETSKGAGTRVIDGAAAIDLFDVKEANLPAPIRVVEPPPASKTPETPPALPFQYIGKMREQGVWEVYVVHQEQFLTVREGDEIARSYVVRTIAPPTMEVFNSDFNELQRLDIGAVAGE